MAFDEFLGRDDLLLLAKVADEAHTWIHSQGREATNPPSESPSPGPGATPAEPAQSKGRRSADSPLAKGRLPAVASNG